ncbi:MAG TPA: protein containing YHS domain protein, partial [bacterium]|nr:protein containing YHS domain protein [bacterium]
DVLMTTGIGFEARNVILVRAADAVIIIGGRIGTVQEFTIAYQSGKVIGILEHSGGNAALLPQIAVNSNRTGGYIITDIDPRELVKRVLKKSR